jgi:hypothetical protein
MAILTMPVPPEATTVESMARVVEREFKHHGPDISIEQWREGQGSANLFTRQRLVRNVPYRNIYGCDSRSDLLYIDDMSGLRLRIELVSQQSSGSVDEKFPFWLINAQTCMPESIIWMVIEGNGPRPGAMQWLKREAAQSAKVIRILSLAELKASVRTVLTELGR